MALSSREILAQKSAMERRPRVVLDSDEEDDVPAINNHSESSDSEDDEETSAIHHVIGSARPQNRTMDRSALLEDDDEDDPRAKRQLDFTSMRGPKTPQSKSRVDSKPFDLTPVSLKKKNSILKGNDVEGNLVQQVSKIQLTDSQSQGSSQPAVGSPKGIFAQLKARNDSEKTRQQKPPAARSGHSPTANGKAGQNTGHSQLGPRRNSNNSGDRPPMPGFRRWKENRSRPPHQNQNQNQNQNRNNNQSQNSNGSNKVNNNNTSRNHSNQHIPNSINHNQRFAKSDGSKIHHQHPPKGKGRKGRRNNNGPNKHLPNGNLQDTLKEPELQPKPEPESESQPKTTFNSPVKSFDKSSGELLELMSPKSKKWGQRIHAHSHRPNVLMPVPGAAGSEDQKQPVQYVKMHSPTENRFHYPTPAVRKTSIVDDMKELLNQFDGLNVDEDEDHTSDRVEGLKVTLMVHQIKGLRFLLDREGNDIKNKGGMLCDDMGLGKTIQSIALILSNPRPKREVTADDSDSDTDYEFSDTESDHEERKPEGEPGDKPVGPKNKVKTTLIVAPVSLTTQWKAEIEAKAPKLKVMVHHGAERTSDWRDLTRYDVVITTYGIVSSDMKSSERPLFRLHWWRIILDEAHEIKNATTKSAMACTALSGINRWCLTGTPIQNKIDELHSLLKFTGIKPYSKANVFNQEVIRPIKAGASARAMHKLQAFLSVIMLRRTKAILGSSGVKLPERKVNFVKLQFTPTERKYYDKFQNHTRSFAARDQQNMVAALAALVQLRQTCCYTKLVATKVELGESEFFKSFEESEIERLKDLAKELDQEVKTLGNEEVGDTSAYLGTSSKIRWLLDKLNEEPERKTIVFSQFTSFLDLIEPGLHKAGLKFSRYDGSMTRQARTDAIARLNKSDCHIMLCSLKAASVGLNLTMANRVIILDPWWNPMIENQAIDRVHRIGQTQVVDVFKLAMDHSIETNIWKLQTKKQELADGIVEGGSKMADSLSKKELMSLFASQ